MNRKYVIYKLIQVTLMLSPSERFGQVTYLLLSLTLLVHKWETMLLPTHCGEEDERRGHV